MNQFIRRRFWPLIGLCAVLAGLVLWAMPAEKTIGQVIKIVYLHGALSRAGMIGFIAAGLLVILVTWLLEIPLRVLREPSRLRDPDPLAAS